jgi:hypothetical protein
MGGLVKQLDLQVHGIRIAANVDSQAESELFHMVE